eukprot:Seg1758.2 transcript_id=Seg1758.2/GoldUCD/mRNA.D3Y31 product="hypothetical protein" protein_id=Seg1758.2/GoldUCD/D3Y31
MYRYHNSTEHQSSITRSTRSEKSVKRESSHYAEKSEGHFGTDINSNYTRSHAVESASYSKSSSTKRGSAIPVRSPSKPPLEAPKRKNNKASSNEDEETPKLERKVKRRPVRKPKKRNNAVVGHDPINEGFQKSRNEGRGFQSAPKQQSDSESESDSLVSSEAGYDSAPRVSINSNKKPTVTVGTSRPIQITYKPSPKTEKRKPVENPRRSPTRDDSDSEDQKRRRRNRDERPKTLPVTFTIRQPEPKARIVIRTSEESSSHSESSDEDTLTSGGESSGIERKRTSIRIVSSAKSSAPSSDNEGGKRKLRIDAKSTKRPKTPERKNTLSDIDRRKQERANDIYNDRTRKLIKRETWKRNSVQESEITANSLKQAQSSPNTGYQTLPRNFKTIRVPLQTQPPPTKKSPNSQPPPSKKSPNSQITPKRNSPNSQVPPRKKSPNSSDQNRKTGPNSQLPPNNKSPNSPDRNRKTSPNSLLQPNRKSPSSPDRNRPVPQSDNSRRSSASSFVRSDNQSDTGQSVNSTQSYDPSLARKSSAVHRCKKGCTHVVDDTTDGPRIVRRARENRRTSNPNEILGRTEIHGLKKERPKSEIVRSASLPRSTERPRINSLGYDEFVEIHDFEGFARNKSKTLPNRKKRVTYHEGTKGLQSLSETELQEDEFQHHLQIHQNFTENVQQQLTETEVENKTTKVNSQVNSQVKGDEKEEIRAKEIRKQSQEQSLNKQKGVTGYQSQETHRQRVSVEEIGVKRQEQEVRSQENRQIERREVKSQQSGHRSQENREVENREGRVVESKEQTIRQVKDQQSAVENTSEGKEKKSKKSRKKKNKVKEEKENKRKVTEQQSEIKEQRSEVREQKQSSEQRTTVKEQIIEEHINARKANNEKIYKEFAEDKIQNTSVQRSKSLPRKESKQEYLTEKEREFDEFIRNQRNLLLNQLHRRESVQQTQEVSSEEKREVKGQETVARVQDTGVKVQEKGVRIQDNSDKKQIIQEEELERSTFERESAGLKLDEFLVYPEASKNKRRLKSANDVDSINKAKEQHRLTREQRSEFTSTAREQRSEFSSVSSEQRSQSQVSASQQSQFLLQNNEEAKVIEKPQSNKEEIIRVYSRGGVIQLSMEEVDREKFEQRQREYEEIQRRRSSSKQQQKYVDDDRYRYMNNEFDKRNINYYTAGEYNTSEARQYDIDVDDIFEDPRDTNTRQITRIKEDQIKGDLDKVYYTICTHYFYPEDHELIVNLHRLGQIEVPRGLDHEDTCIFYNHLYVYEKEEVFAETLAPIIPTIKQEVVTLDEQLPDYDTTSNDDTSSQYSSLSRRERNLYSSLKAQQYYESKLNNNEDSLDFGFDSTYETLRKKRQSYTDDEDIYRPNSPNSSSGRSESFSYAKPRLLRKSDVFPGVGKEVEDDYPRWKPKSPIQPDREYGLSVGMPLK